LFLFLLLSSVSQLILYDELARCGHAPLMSALTNGQALALPPVLKFGSEELKARIAPDVLMGKVRSFSVSSVSFPLVYAFVHLFDLPSSLFLFSLSHYQKFMALAISEPQAGSDVAALECVAKKDGKDYVITGNKKWITNGSMPFAALFALSCCCRFLFLIFFSPLPPLSLSVYADYFTTGLFLLSLLFFCSVLCFLLSSSAFPSC
jgi:hypothetical protein